MVFDRNLGYDPELWEECPEPDHFLAFGFFTRIGLTIVTVGLAGAFFWLLEARKEWGKVDKGSESEKTEVQEHVEPPKKPERRVSRDLLRQMTAEEAIEAINRESDARISSDNQIRSPQRDVRSSRSMERKLKKSLSRDEVEALHEWDRQRQELDQMFDTSRTVDMPSEYPRTQLQSEPQCTTPPEDPRSQLTIEQQYRQLAKDFEEKLIQEIEQLGLLRGRQHDRDAPRLVAEELQQKHGYEIHKAVDDLVNREAGGAPHVANHFKKQLENQIEDAVWQYNHKLIEEMNELGEIYETSLSTEEPHIWQKKAEVEARPQPEEIKQRNNEPEIWEKRVEREHEQTLPDKAEQFVQRTFNQVQEQINQEEPPQFHQKSLQEMPHEQPQHRLHQTQQLSQEEAEEVHQLAEYLQQKMHGNQYPEGLPGQQEQQRSASSPRSPEEIRQLGDEYPYAPPDHTKRGASEGAQMPYQVLQNQTMPVVEAQGTPKKGSSSDEDGFIKVEDPNSPRNRNSNLDFDAPGGIGSPRPSSYDGGSSITADDIEFVPSVHQQEKKEYIDVFDEKPPPQQRQKRGISDNDYQNYGQDEWAQVQASSQLQQVKQPQIPQEQPKKQIDPNEEAKVLELLQEYDLSPPSRQPQQKKHQDLHLELPLQKQPSPQSSPVGSPNQLGYTVVDFVPIEPSTPGSLPPEDSIFRNSPQDQEYQYQQPQHYQNQNLTAKDDSGYENLLPEQSQPRYQQPQQQISKHNQRDNLPELATADIYLQDAIDFMEAQRPATSHSDGGFIVEEEMLESDKISPPVLRHNEQQQHQQGHQPNLSELEKQLKPISEGGKSTNVNTSRMIKTNEAFEKPDFSFDDADDAITSAPEIQSIEVPPDQISESSSNYIENIPDHHEYRPGSSRAISPGLAPNDINLGIYNESQRSDSRASNKKPEAPKMYRVSPVPDDQSVSESFACYERHPYQMRKQSSLLSILNVTSMQEMLLTLTSLDGLSIALRKAGLNSTNLIFGIDYTASNKYQGEKSFYGKSLHSVDDPKLENPYQQVIRIMGNSLAPFASTGSIPVFGFGDATTGDWSVFKLKPGDGQCKDLDEVLRVYNEVTPTVDLSGSTNFAPIINKATEICRINQDYHILVIMADGQVTNERATRKAIVHACQYPLSIIVVGVGDGPFDMMRVFDESLPKRPWDNFHFVEFHEIINACEPGSKESDLAFAVQALLEIPDQYATIKRLGLLNGTLSSRVSRRHSSRQDKKH